jgi:hypothetical protein
MPPQKNSFVRDLTLAAASTLTTASGAAHASEAAPKHAAAAMATKRMVIFTVICFSSKNIAETCLLYH